MSRSAWWLISAAIVVAEVEWWARDCYEERHVDIGAR